MKKTVVRIPSLLYKQLFDIGGDKLIAVFSILKGSREGKIKYYSYKANNNKTVSGYALLRKETCLSLHTLKKYIPSLVELGLCSFHDNGDFTVMGNRLLKDKYNYKLVPITLGINFTDTQYNSFSVRLHSSSKSQKIAISKKRYRSEQILQFDNPKTLKQYKTVKRLLKQYGGDIQILDNIVLSNESYSEIKGKERSKSSGSYYKSKLIEKGIISSKRRFKLIKKMSYQEYTLFKKYNYFSGIHYMRGCLAAEQVASMVVYDTTKGFYKKQTKAIPMDFDFIGWLENSALQ